MFMRQEGTRTWSRRVRAVNCVLGMVGAYSAVIRALVLAGLPTTRTYNADHDTCDHHLGFSAYFDGLLGNSVEGVTLNLENLGIGLKKVLALHAFLAGHGTNLQTAIECKNEW